MTRATRYHRPVSRDDELAETTQTMTPPELGTRSSPEQPEPVAGDELTQRYVVLGLLGRGGMGVVYKAKDRVADEVVAMKLLLPRVSSIEGMTERLRRELRVARRVSHPGVVRLHDLIDLGGRLALSMEYVEGQSLQSLLAGSPRLSPQRLSALALDLASALAAAHAVGVVHRDLKPANILLREPRGQAVITDFGLSRIGEGTPAAIAQPSLTSSQDLTLTGQVLGTPLYMAPEQFAGEAGPAADVFSAGLVLYEAATGEVPHRTAVLVDLMRARREEKTPSVLSMRPDLDPAFGAVIDRCVEIEPARRFEDGGALLLALGDVGTVNLRTRPAPTTPEVPRRRRAPWIALALALAGVGLWRIRARVPSLPAADRRVVVRVEARAPPTPWFEAASTRLIERALATGSPRFQVGSAASANVPLRAVLETSQSGVTLELALGPPDAVIVVARVEHARSVEAAIAKLVPSIVQVLDEGQPARPAGADRLAARALVGGRSAEAFSAYSEGLDATFANVTNDATRARGRFEEALRLQPGWGHAWLGRVLNDPAGLPGTAHQALAAADATADPRGRRALEAFVLQLGGQPERAAELLESMVAEVPEDVLLTYLLAQLHQVRRRMDDATSMYRRLYALRPDLQFGSDLAEHLELTSRGAEVPALLDDWIARAPDSEQAITTRAVRGMEHDPALAERLARSLLVLRGESPARLGLLVDALIVTGRLDEAVRSGDALLSSGPDQRWAARVRLGLIAILRGRFASAREALEPALDGPRDSLGVPSVGAHQMLEGLALATGDRALALRESRAMVGLLARATDAAHHAVVERAFARLFDPGRRACPKATELGALPRPARAYAERSIARAASAFGCGSCKVALAGGASTSDPQLPTYWYARCALAEGALEQARAAFERASQLHTPSQSAFFLGSPAHAVLARYQLGVVYERLGRLADARRAYQSFLDAWGDADRPLPEIADARARLADLH